MPLLTAKTNFIRKARVTLAIPNAAGLDVAATQYEKLQIRFHIRRSLRPEPCRVDATITNLSKATRQRLSSVQKQGANRIVLILEASYDPLRDGSQMQIIAKGTVRHLSHEKHSAQWETVFQCADGGVQYVGATTSFAYAGSITLDQVCQKLAADYGVGLGNLNQALQAARANGQVTDFPNGFSASGLASTNLERVLAAAGLEYSIQDGQLQVLQRNTGKAGRVFLLNASSGVLNSPEWGEWTPDRGSYLNVKCELIPALRAGSVVRLESETATGYFRIETLEQSGDTHGADWVSKLELASLASPTAVT